MPGTLKNVPGRKSDVSDCQWIQRLHTFGLLRGSFRPTAEITAIRTLLRHRAVPMRSRHPRGGGGRLYPTDAEGVDADEPPAPQRDQATCPDRGSTASGSGLHMACAAFLREITAIRTLLRHRTPSWRGSAACIQRMQKALTLMNLQLHNVISDVTGVTGMLILRDSVAGMTDPAVLARHRHPQCRASKAEIAASLTGHSRDEHLFVLRQELEVYDCYHEKIRRGDEQIETRVHALQAQCEPPGRALPASRKPSPKSKRQDNTPSFEIRSPLFTLCGGVDLTALPGLGPYGALRLISEIGVDMHCWPTEHHFASWLTLAPNNRISGGKLLGSRTQPSANRAAKILRLAAMALVRGDHALGAFYRRLAARTDKPTAMTATARKLALLVYRMLKYNMPYEQTSAAEYDERQHTRILRGLRKRATSLGFELVEASTGLVG